MSHRILTVDDNKEQIFKKCIILNYTNIDQINSCVTIEVRILIEMPAFSKYRNE